MVTEGGYRTSPSDKGPWDGRLKKGMSECVALTSLGFEENQDDRYSRVQMNGL